MKSQKTIFWDVDTQFDFMRPEGALYVPGAEEIIDKVGEVRLFALDNGYSILSDIDWHRRDNPEISDPAAPCRRAISPSRLRKGPQNARPLSR